MDNSAPNPLRVVTLLQQLKQRFGPQEFGQIVQTLLALTFRKAGFGALKNTVGVPDLVISRPGSGGGFAIEVKTGESKITLSRRDLDGVLTSGKVPVVAALFLSDPSPHWMLTDARSLRPLSYRRFELEGKPTVDPGFAVTEGFCRILVKNHAVSMEGPTPLARLLES
ncbi:MAG: hypothetical protein JRN24_04085 [Nitrososphaerota archaeon]|nr:hypothetical protein [Nitrososphaerota archaeon]